MDSPIPEFVEQTPTAEIPLETKTRDRLRIIYAIGLGALMMGDVALYSHHKALESRVESQERRLERIGNMLSDLMASSDNAKKIEGIKVQVDGIETSVNDLQKLVKAKYEAESSGMLPDEQSAD